MKKPNTTMVQLTLNKRHGTLTIWSGPWLQVETLLRAG
ncbi:hypothetical protein BDD14_2296 [Edaphobacter modestus]|uniref:Uncharacterized protein n=1 Tax=Edaphobacter modestus TaxID=388466 RepID=A0A4Q7YUN1_9BACT|nr:hypothetical protein BDD14_2296 [Edaphobacter modestus]